KVFNVVKVAVTFTVLLDGPEQPEEQVTLERWYRIDTKRGRITAGRHSDYRREWCVATGRLPTRGDRLTPSVFARVLFRVVVKTVDHDARRRGLAEPNRYSVVAQVVERLAGGPQR